MLVGRHGPGPLEDPTVLELANKYNKTPAQIVLCHTVCRGVSVVPKSNNLRRVGGDCGSLFALAEGGFRKMEELVGIDGEFGVRNLEMTAYLGFDNFNEDVEEP